MCWRSLSVQWRNLNVLGNSLGVLGRSLGVLGRSLVVLGRSLGVLGRSLDVLGRSLEGKSNLPGPVQGARASPACQAMQFTALCTNQPCVLHQGCNHIAGAT